MGKYRFVAIDVDGTLLNDHDQYDITRLNRDVAALQNRGIHFIVASGNSYDALQALFEDSPVVQDFVAENGGRIIADGKEILSHYHQDTTLEKLLDIISTTFPIPDLLSLSGQTKTYIADEYKSVAVPFYPHHAYFSTLADINEQVYNLNVNWFKQRLPQSRIQNMVTQLNRILSGEIQATYSGAYGIDILPAGVNKAVGLRNLICTSLGGKMDQVVAFGDTSNDIEMLQAAGIGFAMRNATVDLLAVADRVTSLDNNHDGLLNEIEKFFSL